MTEERKATRKASRMRDTGADRRSARERGLKYYMGEPCEHAHKGKRYTSSGHCVECRTPYVAGRGALPPLDTLHADRTVAEATGALYFRGGICRRGHIQGIRYVKSGHCVECSREPREPDSGATSTAAQVRFWRRRMRKLGQEHAACAARIAELEGK